MKKISIRLGVLASALTVACTAVAFGTQTKTGDPAPSFSVTSMGGRQVFFKDMQTGGPIFIYFIRDGDPVTQQMTSYINKIIRSYGKSRSTWYGILNTQMERARSYQAETMPAFRLERDENMAAVKAFAVVSSPTVFEYDGNGMLMNIWKGYSAVNLKAINLAVSSASHKPVHEIDFTAAPSTLQFGLDYSPITKSSGF
jgi:hypothetical protein